MADDFQKIDVAYRFEVNRGETPNGVGCERKVSTLYGFFLKHLSNPGFSSPETLAMRRGFGKRKYKTIVLDESCVNPDTALQS